MELKVWVEGIPRVICGVTQDTTCHEVVIALAHATGKTGRFTLVEKWKNSERLVAPTEKPLLSLHKWGEYAPDVQFILHHAKSRLDRRTGQFNQHNFTPHLPEPSAGKNIKKSLTFSGAHFRTQEQGKHKDNSSGETPEESSVTSHSSKSSVSPYSSLEKKKPNGNHVLQSPYKSITSSSPALSPGVPSHLTPAGSPEKSQSTGTLHDPVHLAPSSSQSPNLKLNTRPSRPSGPPGNLHNSTPILNHRLEEYDLEKHLRPCSDLDLAKVNGDKINGVNGGSYQEKVIEGTDKESLLRLIKEQQVRLEEQEVQLRGIDTGIHFSALFLDHVKIYCNIIKSN